MSLYKDILIQKNPTSSSSDYSTCSDNHCENVMMNTDKLQMSTQSTILAGQLLPDYQPNNDTMNETNYSVNFLDQNLDVLTEDDIFTDCKDSSISDLNENDSTKYVQLESIAKLSKTKSSNHFSNSDSDSDKLNEQQTVNSKSYNLLQLAKNSQNENAHLVTIMEESEITHTSNSVIVKIPSSVSAQNTTGTLLVEMMDELKNCDRLSHCNKNSTNTVFFANEANIMQDVCQKCTSGKTKLKKRYKTSNLLVGKNRYCAWKEKDIDENCNNHNTTESFVLWEKFCEASDKLSPRRSFSFSELSSVTESCGGDDEYSTSYNTLEDTYISYCSFDSTLGKDVSQKKCFRHRSKSCESLLKEVKHLPHILYDRFLKCLANEIENMRKQNVLCTCRKVNQKHKSKENIGKTSKSAIKPIIKITNLEDDHTEPKHLLKVSSLRVNTNQTRLSPETLIKSSSEKVQKLSPKSPNKTTTTPKKRGLYSWHKEIVSPVGEYIKGKRQSPFKGSPNKKKV